MFIPRRYQDWRWQNNPWKQIEWPHSGILSVKVMEMFCDVYRVTHQVVPKLSAQGLFNSHNSPESRVWEQPDATWYTLNYNYGADMNDPIRTLVASLDHNSARMPIRLILLTDQESVAIILKVMGRCSYLGWHITYNASRILWHHYWKWSKTHKNNLLYWNPFISHYRVTIQVDSNLPLTSVEKLSFNMWFMY